MNISWSYDQEEFKDLKLNSILLTHEHEYLSFERLNITNIDG